MRGDLRKLVFKRFLLLSFIIILFFGLVEVKGQSRTPTSEEEQLIEQIKSKPLNGFFGVTLTNSVPQGDFQSNLKKSGFGFSLYGGYYADPIPVAFGLQFDMLFYGGETRKFYYERQGGWCWGTDTVETSTILFPLSLFVRVQPNMKYVLPYFEGFFGITMMNTDAQYNPYWGPEDSKSKFTAAFHYGGSVGLMITIVDFVQVMNNNYTSLTADIKLRYIKGNEADYYTAKIREDSGVDFKNYRSTTDMLNLMFGVAFRF